MARIEFTASKPCLARGSEPELLLQGVQERLGHPLPDTHRAIALDVAVPTHRARSCPRSTQIPAQQQEVDDLADRRHTVLLLGQAHRPAGDDLLAGQDPLDRLLDVRTRQAGRFNDIRPGNLPTSSANSANPVVCALMKGWSSTVSGAAASALPAAGR